MEVFLVLAMRPVQIHIEPFGALSVQPSGQFQGVHENRPEEALHGAGQVKEIQGVGGK